MGPAAKSQQVDTGYLKALYDRCIGFDESKADSVSIYAAFIAREAKRLDYNKGNVLSVRLKGIAQDLRGNYDSAISYYFQSLNAARELKLLKYEISALNDLAYVYVNTKQPSRAKEMYIECVRLTEIGRDAHSLVVAYSNQGAIYNQLKQRDSALFFLNKARAVGLASMIKIDLSSVYNNIGNVYYEEKAYDKALFYFRENYNKHLSDSSRGDLWTDELNMADTYTRQKLFDSAYKYGLSSLKIARQLESRSKEADSYAILAKLYAGNGNYRQAYNYQQKWYTLDTGLVNTGTNKVIADLQERYNASQREQENKLLQSEIDKAYLRNRAVTFMAIAAAIVAVIVALSLMLKRQANNRLKIQNNLIRQQNEKLSALNEEKNSIISIVSHDLSTPFSAINMWSQVLQSDIANLTAEQQQALGRIKGSAAKGEALIRTILDVEKSVTRQPEIQLENIDLRSFIENLVSEFRPSASVKSINLNFDSPERKIYLVSDKQLIGRIVENLLSNPIKFTPRGKNVWINLADDKDAVYFKIRDEGVGIKQEEIAYLFSKYSMVSSKPTQGESSTGLGLYIVKRIVQELNGTLSCESEPGRGSLFTVTLRK
jgi:signal transduction histidine kinase